MEVDQNNTNKGSQEKSWASLVHEFLNSPPTSSIFRVYLLSFIIWNKGVLLYIFFGNADMADKLAFVNWGKYVIFSSIQFCPKIIVYLSFYLGPVLFTCVIFFIVFQKLNFQIWFFDFKNVSFYNYLYKIHIKSEIERLKEEEKKEEAEKSKINVEKEKVAAQIALIDKKEEVEKKKEESKPNFILNNPTWEKDYLYFKKTSHFTNFKKAVSLFYDTKNVFGYGMLKDHHFQPDVMPVYFYLIQDQCLSFVDKRRPNSILSNQDSVTDYEQIKFNKKGEFYIKYYEWEQSNKFSRF